VPEKNETRPGEDAWRLQLLIDSVIDYAIYMIDLDGHKNALERFTEADP
jgi:hypothetical protein